MSASTAEVNHDQEYHVRKEECCTNGWMFSMHQQFDKKNIPDDRDCFVFAISIFCVGAILSSAQNIKANFSSCRLGLAEK